MNFRILDLDELQGRNCVEGYLENDLSKVAQKELEQLFAWKSL